MLLHFIYSFLLCILQNAVVKCTCVKENMRKRTLIFLKPSKIMTNLVVQGIATLSYFCHNTSWLTWMAVLMLLLKVLQSKSVLSNILGFEFFTGGILHRDIILWQPQIVSVDSTFCFWFYTEKFLLLF